MDNATAKSKMTPLLNQETFEELIGRNKNKPQEGITIVYFTAKWCGPCNRLGLGQLLALSDKIKWYLCDVDENDYTPGFCGIKSIPSFMAILNGKPQPLYSNSDTQAVIQWIKGGFKQ